MNRKLIKRNSFFFIVSLCVIILNACSTRSSISYTFNVETGDKIEVSLDTSEGGYSLSQKDGRFTVKTDDTTILEGAFATKEMYDQQLEAVYNSTASKMEEKEKDGNSYLFYEYEGESGTEDNFILWIKGSNTGIFLASLSGEEDAKSAFNCLSFSKE